MTKFNSLFFLFLILPLNFSLVSSLDVDPGGSSQPLHGNHSYMSVDATSNGVTLELVAVGDVEGFREVIVWMRLRNNLDSYMVIDPRLMEFKVDDGPWRDCYYHRWSQQFGEMECDGLVEKIWKHGRYNLSPRSCIGLWAVWRLPRYQFQEMSRVALRYPRAGITLAGNISGSRVPGETRYLVITEPNQGAELARLWSVCFRVYDVDVEPIEIDWRVEVDGEIILEGHARQSYIGNDACPVVVDKKIDLVLPDGVHRLVVYVSDGRTEASAGVNFSTEFREPEVPLLGVEWIVNMSDLTSSIVGPGHRGCQTVWDVDGDGVMEMVFGNGRGDTKRLWCVDADSRLEWMYPPPDMPGLPGNPGKVSLVDVDADGVYELCLAGRGGRLHVLNGDGQLVWYWDEPDRADMFGAPQALDVDGDGFVEFFLSTNHGYIHRVSHEGELVWTSFQTLPGNGGHPTVCDIDRDGEFEVVWACQDHNVYCIDAGSGLERWRFDTGSNMEFNNVIVADIDGDGEFEALAWTSPPMSSVFSISHEGVEEWSWRHPRQGTIRLCQAVGDLDRDGGMDMVVMSSDAGFALNISGDSPEVIWEVNFTEMSQSGELPWGATANYWSSYQTIADIDGDGELEVLWLAPFPIVTDGATGRLEAYYMNENVAVNRRAENGGWWGDIDGDNVSEWIVELGGHTYQETQLYSLTLGGQYPAPSPWPEYYHTAYPAEYQREQEWLTLKSAGSNSLWFPITELLLPLLFVGLICFLRGFSYRPPTTRED